MIKADDGGIELYDATFAEKNIMTLSPGTPAPDFTLFNSDKNQVTLSGLKGNNILLLFFPFAFSRVCTAELCSVRDSLSIYENLQVMPLGLSVDSLYTLARFREEERLNFPLLSDFNKETSAAYGVLYETFNYGMRGVSKRAAFIVDRMGIIRYAETLEDPGLQPDFAAIRQALQQLAG